MTKRIAHAALFTLALAGCTTVTDTYDRWFGSSPGPKPAPLVAFKPITQPKIVWRGEVGAAERTVFFPAVTGNVVYGAGAAGQISGFDVATGKVVARINAG